jgi:hypothetical protein
MLCHEPVGGIPNGWLRGFRRLCSFRDCLSGLAVSCWIMPVTADRFPRGRDEPCLRQGEPAAVK